MNWSPTTDRCEGECMCRREWREATAEEFADAIEALCVEGKDGCKCDPCRCRTGDVAEKGNW